MVRQHKLLLFACCTCTHVSHEATSPEKTEHREAQRMPAASLSFPALHHLPAGQFPPPPFRAAYRSRGQSPSPPRQSTPTPALSSCLPIQKTKNNKKHSTSLHLRSLTKPCGRRQGQGGRGLEAWKLPCSQQRSQQLLKLDARSVHNTTRAWP